VSLIEVLPSVQTLLPADKLRLIQFLAQDLAQGEAEPLLAAGQSYPLWSPFDAFDAAAALLRALESERGQPGAYQSNNTPSSSAMPARGRLV
jgi:hypothetical protein